MASQGPRKGAGGSTRQGIYTFTADGDLLEFKNAGQDVVATRDQLERALKKWKALPSVKTKPGVVTVPEHGKLDAKYSRTPPVNGQIVKVYARILDVKDNGFCRGTCESAGGMKVFRCAYQQRRLCRGLRLQQEIGSRWNAAAGKQRNLARPRYSMRSAEAFLHVFVRRIESMRAPLSSLISARMRRRTGASWSRPGRYQFSIRVMYAGSSS